MCDTAVVVGASGVLFAKSSDRDANEAQLLEWHPRRRSEPGARVRCTWMSIPQVRETNAVLLSRPFWMFGAEIGANEHGVTIGNEAVFTREAVPAIGLTGMDLLRLALERASTAKEAVDTIVSLAEEHGQGGRCGHEDPGFRYFSSFLVADPRRAYVLETAGRAFAIEEVHGARTISNALSIPSFAAAHAATLVPWAIDARARRACTTAAFGRARSASDAMAALRSHGDGAMAARPSYGPLVGASRGPCAHAGGLVAGMQTVASWVAELRPGGVAHWVTGTAAPCTSLFKPVAVDEPLDLGPTPADRDDGRSLWWRHERLHRAVMRDPARLLPLFSAERDAVEARWAIARPGSRAAFAEADALLAAWTERLERLERLDRVKGESVSDRRPPWARRFWRDRQERAR
ncbi:MAG: peptidase U34 [Deltaproteobacteria bacterium]|nr:peptidase U34 [Deltaproteobacteria bacterium]